MHFVKNTYHKDNRADGKRRKAKVLAKACELLLEWRLPFLLRIQHVGNLAHFGIHAGGSNHRARTAVRDATAGVYHVAPIAKWGVFLHF